MRTFVATVVALALAGTAVIAQQKAPAEATTFAKKVASANTFEIQSSELAKDRAAANGGTSGSGGDTDDTHV